MKTMKVLAASAALTMAVLAAPGAQAHHAINAQFDPDKIVKVKGVMASYELINPHSYVHLYLMNAQGQKELWSFETSAPAALRRAGLRAADAFKPGDSYEFSYHPARNGSKTGLLNTITMPDGRVFGVGTANSLTGAR